MQPTQTLVHRMQERSATTIEAELMHVYVLDKSRVFGPSPPEYM